MVMFFDQKPLTSTAESEGLDGQVGSEFLDNEFVIRTY